MFASVRGTRLYFDIDGAGLVPDGGAMRERPGRLAASMAGRAAITAASSPR